MRRLTKTKACHLKYQYICQPDGDQEEVPIIDFGEFKRKHLLKQGGGPFKLQSVETHCGRSSSIQSKAQAPSLIGPDKPVLGRVSITESITDCSRWKAATGFLQARFPVLEPGTVNLVSNPWPQKGEAAVDCPLSSYLRDCELSTEGHVAVREPRESCQRRTFWEAFWFQRRWAVPYRSGQPRQDREG